MSLKESEKIIFIDFGRKSAINYINTIEKEREERIKEQLTQANVNIKIYIKTYIIDSKSYRHLEMFYFEDSDPLVIQTKYIANNAFGIPVQGLLKVQVDEKGEIINVLEFN